MKDKINQAFIDFDNGERPEAYRPPRSWYVLSEDGKSYPAKAIWSLATKIKLANFNTKDARNELAKLDFSLIDTRNTYEHNLFDAEVEKSKLDTHENRAKRLEKAPKMPEASYRLVKTYKRNPDVVAEVLFRANGKCESCKKDAPFKRKRDLTPYLEVHHIKQLSSGGEDTVKNAIAVCPNCHRERHYG